MSLYEYFSYFRTVSPPLGGKWVYLGTYRVGAWDDWNVEISNQSSGSRYIVADAIKVVQQ